MKPYRLIRPLLPAFLLCLSLSNTSIQAQKLLSPNTQISFFSNTPAEAIQSVNNSVISTLDTASGEVAYSVPMQSFQFEKALMQRHFNQRNFLDTQAHPYATFRGRITNLDSINFSQDGVYPTTITGNLIIKGQDHEITETGTFTVKGNTLLAEAKFNLTLADFGVTFNGGKPARNIAKIVEVTVTAPYNSRVQ